MRPLAVGVAVVLGLVGLVWIGQGTGLIGGSAMTGSSFWAVAGFAMLAVAGWILVLERRRSPRG